jgi:hypothetical protein
MRTLPFARIVIVVLPLAGAAGHVSDAGSSVQAAGAPPVVQSGHRWHDLRTVTEIVRDITEMSAAKRAAAAHVTVRAVVADSGHFAVSLGGGAPLVDIDLTSEQWAPAAFADVARAAFSGPAGGVREGETIHEPLVEFTPLALVSANTVVSQALRIDIEDARAHESAALLLGAFALRESGARWAIDRMTAHLAIARALRGDEVPGVDGELAEITRLVLTGADAQALTRMDIRTVSSGAEAAWLRALRAHATQDAGALDGLPTLSGIEQHAYQRAQRLAASAADDRRDASAAHREGGRPKTLPAEYRDVFQQMHGRPIGNVNDALMVRAGRAMGPTGLEVLPWGAWAESAQRHRR